MASLEKLVKALEALRQTGAASDDGAIRGRKEQVLSKKDKIASCNVVADCICSPNISSTSDFPKFLGITMETFLTLCDDSDSDVKIVADECLNRVIRVLMKSNLTRVQVELYKEIKKNGPARCLRAALWRFAELAHLILPQKCRPYVVNLLPCLIRICQRSEEMVQETLASSMLKICPVLMVFMADNETKMLIQSFVHNLRSDSFTIRRTAAQCLLLICQHSRKPATFTVWTLNILLEIARAAQNVNASTDRSNNAEEVVGVAGAGVENAHSVLGVLLAVRHLTPLLNVASVRNEQQQQLKGTKNTEPDARIELSLVIKVLKLLLSLLKHRDHNVITATLEALHQLLKHAPSQLRSTLVSHTDINALLAQTIQLSRSQARLPSVTDESGFSDVTDDVSAADDQGVDLSQSCDISQGRPDDLLVAGVESNATGGMAAAETSEAMDDETDEENDSETFDLDQQIPPPSSSVPSVMTSSVTADTDYSSIDVGSMSTDVAMSTSSSYDPLPIAGIAPHGRVEPRVNSPSSDDEDISAVIDRLAVESSDMASQPEGQFQVRQGDVGRLDDPDEPPIVYLVRTLCAEFLLTGYQYGTIPDRCVRVSVKALALSCLADLMDLYPRTFIMKLHKSTPEPGELQEICDIVQYTSHSDPQLKGNSALIIGHFIRASLGEGHGSWVDWLSSQQAGLSHLSDKYSLNELMNHLVSLLDDDSAVATRLTLSALKLCLPAICNSYHSDQALKLLLALLRLKSTSYWLVKVELLELLTEVDYKAIVYLESLGISSFATSRHRYLGQLDIQDRILTDVMLRLLADEDQRVRHAAAAAICRLVPNLFFPSDNPAHDPVTAKSIEFTASHLQQVSDESSVKLTPLFGLTLKPFSDVGPAASTLSSSQIESALSRVVTKITHALIQSNNKYATLGCCRALAVLSETYSVIQFAGVWGCCQLVALSGGSHPSAKRVGRSLSGGSSGGSMSNSMDESLLRSSTSGGGPLSLVISLLTASPIALDLSAQADLLQLAGTLLAGAAFKCLRSPEDVTSTSAEDQRWVSLSDRMLVTMADQLFLHLIRLLNICSHVIDEVTPGPPPTKPTLPSLPNAPSLSPIRRKAKGATGSSGKEDHSMAQSTPAKDKSSGRTPSKDGKDSESNKDAKNRKEGIGVFYMLPHYVKLYDVLKGAFANYKISLDIGSSSDKLAHVLKMALLAMSQLLEVACLSDVGKYADELLGYLYTAINYEPADTVLCVQQLLKAIFGANLAGQWEPHVAASPQRPSVTKTTNRSTSSTSVKPGIYHSCLNQPYIQFTQLLDTTRTKMSAVSPSTVTGSAAPVEPEESSGLIGWLKKRAEKKPASVSKLAAKSASTTTADRTSVASYIRLFEPLVIKSLKQYTVTSQVALQQRVLDLLAQLVQLRVNYCLLDSDQIFIGYVIKQFEFVEEGQMRNADLLIPHIFNFLVLLSYERYHSKTIVQIPKIIQLCDGIMASGQDPTKHAFPALQCIVFDLFVVRGANKSNLGKDLETQQEVVISMLLRLLPYYQILELFIIVLHQCRKDSEERWKRLSRQVIDLLLPLLHQLQVNIDGQTALSVVHRLMESVAPSVFRPIDILLKVLFAKPSSPLTCVRDIERWVGLVLISLRVILTQSKEEVVLGRLQQLGLTVCFTDFPQTADSQQQQQTSTNSEVVFASFLLQVVSMVVMEITGREFNWLPSTTTSDSCSLLCQELSHLLLYIAHMFQSGVCRRVAMAAMSLLHDSDKVDDPGLQSFSVQRVNEGFHAIGLTHPTLMVQWCNILILLNYGDQTWWSQLLQTPHTYLSAITSHVGCERVLNSGSLYCLSINSEVVRRGGLILYCDYVCENLTDAEHMTWLIINHIFDLICLISEPPVQDFMSAVHRNSAASGLLIQAIHSRSETLLKLSPVLIQRTIQCLNAVHLAQSGALVTLLVECFLNTHHLTLARMADSVACRRVETLLADTSEDGTNQMSIDDIDKLLHFMNKQQLSERHSRLATLLYKLSEAVCCELNSRSITLAEKPRPLTLTPGSVSDMELNKDWYVSLVTDLCCCYKIEARHCVQLLQYLDYTSILTIIMHKNCHAGVLNECILLGAKRTLQLDSCPSSPLHSPLPSPPAHTADSNEAGNLLDPLLRAAELTLLRRISGVINMLPVPHQVVHFDNCKLSDRYREHIDELFAETHYFRSILHLSGALYSHLCALQSLPWQRDIPPESVKDVARFATLAMEVLYWTLAHDRLLPSDHLLTILSCYSAVVYNCQLVSLLSEQENTSMICSAILAVHTLVCSLLVVPGESLGRLPDQESQDDLPNSSFNDGHYAIRACDQISELLDGLSTFLNPHHRSPKLPLFLSKPLTSCIVGLARMPLVNSYARTPPAVWKLGWMPSPSGDHKTHLPPLPLEYLRERDILAEFIRRVNVIGWTSRQQFEETWMSLLGVLNPLPADGSQNVPSTEEQIEKVQCQVLATRGITALLIQSTLTPVCGNPGNSQCEYRPRNKPLAFFSTRNGKRLSEVRWIIEEELNRSHGSCSHTLMRPASMVNKSAVLLTENIERTCVGTNIELQLGQLSIESLWAWIGILDTMRMRSSVHSPSSESADSSTADTPTSELAGGNTGLVLHPVLPVLPSSLGGTVEVRSAQRCGLDIHSCLQLLLDVYGSTLLSTSTVPVAFLNETIRSIVILTDVFTDKTQFESMLTTLLDVQKNYHVEDELVYQYLVVGICKAAAIVGLDTLLVERVFRVIETCLRSTHLPTKISALYGCMYLLEMGLSDITHHLITLLTDYLLRSLASITPYIIYSEQHVLIMWSLAFYLAENYVQEVREFDFISKLFQLCVSVVSLDEEELSISIYLAILHGLERIILTDSFVGRPLSEPSLVDAIVKLSIDRLCQPSPQRSLAALGLLLTCMYSGLPVDAPGTDVPITTNPEDNALYNPETLIVAMERVMVLFDRIRKGYPYEARVITRILPAFLMDFFPPQDIMNKVIAEFLSCQQPHPELMANVVFQVFEKMIGMKQTSLVDNWVILSLSNFTQRTPLAMAIWSLTCFFISASNTHWLRALMPLVVSRVGRLEAVDHQLFVVAARDFYSQLDYDVSHRRAFISTFTSVAQPDTPYADVLKVCAAPQWSGPTSQ